MLRLAKEREELAVINDQFGVPTGAELLADCTAHAIRVALNKPDVAGLYHLVASGTTTGTIMLRWFLKRRAKQAFPLHSTSSTQYQQLPILHQLVVHITLALIQKNFSRTLRLSCLTGRLVLNECSTNYLRLQQSNNFCILFVMVEQDELKGMMK